MSARISQLRLPSFLRTGTTICQKRVPCARTHRTWIQSRNVSSAHDEVTQPLKLSRTRPVIPQQTAISTFNPNKMQPMDYINLSNTSRFNIEVPNSKSLWIVKYSFGDAWRFPENCKGFFYFHKEPGMHIVQASIRFRITGNPDPSTFQQGHDLTCSQHGRVWPWGLNILQLITYYKDIVELLIADGLITQEDYQLCKNIIRNSGIKKPPVHISRRQVITDISDPFVLDLEETLSMYILQPDKAELFLIARPSPLLNTYGRETGYRGQCRVRFEPESYKRSSTGAVPCNVRILEALSPIEKTGPSPVQKPEAGSLLTRENGRPVVVNMLFTKKSGSSPSRAERRPRISSLDISRVKPDDVMDMSDTVRLRCNTVGGSATLFYKGHSRFPPNTLGYLYFHRFPDAPAISGELRFRLVKDRRHRALTSDQDLMDRDESRPWSVPLIDIVNRKSCHPFLMQLLEDGLITQGDIDMCQQILAHETCPAYICSSSAFLYGQKYPFILDFTRSSRLRFYFVNTDPPMVHSALAQTLTMEGRGGVMSQPYKAGKCLAHLEEVPRDDPEQKKTFKVRVIEIMEPFKTAEPNYDGYLEMPSKGEYLRRGGKDIIINTFNPPMY